MLALLAAAVAWLAQAQEVRVEPAHPLILECEHPGEPLLIRVSQPGRLHVWAASTELDLDLRLIRSDGSAAGWDAGSGGGTTPYLSAGVEQDELLRVLVEGEGAGGIEVHAAISVEDHVVRDTLAMARKARSEAERLFALGERDEAGAILVEIARELVRTLETSDSLELGEELESLARAHGPLLWTEVLSAAVDGVHAHRRRIFPPRHPARVGMRFNAAWTLNLQGELLRAHREYEAAWQEACPSPDDLDLTLARYGVGLAFLRWRIGMLHEALELLEPAREMLDAQATELDMDWFWCQQVLADVLTGLGRFDEALALWELLVPLAPRVYPPDHHNLFWVRTGFARTLSESGQLERAAGFQEELLAEALGNRSIYPMALLWAKTHLANTLARQGRYQRARDLLEEVVEERERSTSEPNPGLTDARFSLAAVLFGMGDCRGALDLQQQVLLDWENRMHPDSKPLLGARGNLALTLAALGRDEEALPIQEELLASMDARGPGDSRERGHLLNNLSATLLSLGQVARARELAERAVRIAEREYGEDHRALQAARGQLASVFHELGDFSSQRDVLEQIVDSASRSMPEDSVDLLRFRGKLAHAWTHLGEFERARELLESVHANLRAALGPTSSATQMSRSDLAYLYLLLDRPEDACRLLEEGPETSRHMLALAMAQRGELDRAREIAERSMGALNLGEVGDPNGQRGRLGALICISSEQGDRDVALRTGLRLVEDTQSQLESNVFALAPRELEALASRISLSAHLALSLIAESGEDRSVRPLALKTFALVETLRGATATSARGLAEQAGDPAIANLRSAARQAGERLTEQAQGEGGRDALRDAVARRDDALRELAASLRKDPRTRALLVVPTVEALGRGLASEEALVGFVRCSRQGGEKSWLRPGLPHLTAFVVRADAGLARVELGPLAAIEQAVESWRTDLTAHVVLSEADPTAPLERGEGFGGSRDAHDSLASGRRVRELVLDPLKAYLGGASRLTVALDDVLHAVPLDALPAGDGLVGDSLSITLRATLRELLWPPRTPSTGVLVALGGASFDAAPGDDQGENTQGAASGVATILRGGVWERGFAPLPETSAEALGVAELFGEAFGSESSAVVLLGREATRESLERLAPRARWLHLATHGWFAPESVRTLDEALATDADLGIEIGVTREERLRASSPMVLCGLALAGANRPPDEVGRLPGLLTAEELAALDLGACELAVLSACDTNVGIRRAGQGVSSLQKALHMAGARSVITSLWKVPDAATRELMLEFYRRLWVQGEPKAKALWGAKMRLRNACDPDGRPLYRTRDWAGWVLTGDPD